LHADAASVVVAAAAASRNSRATAQGAAADGFVVISVSERLSRESLVLIEWCAYVVVVRSAPACRGVLGALRGTICSGRGRR
jgi:hypothetical protein